MNVRDLCWYKPVAFNAVGRRDHHPVSNTEIFVRTLVPVVEHTKFVAEMALKFIEEFILDEALFTGRDGQVRLRIF